MPKSKNIHQELIEISQPVAELTEETPFNPPHTSYFEGFPDQILSRIKEIQEEPSTDFLNDLKHEMPFEIPDGYFGQFKPQIPKENVKSGKIIPFRIFLRYAIAACIIGFIATWGLFSGVQNGTENNTATAMEFNIEGISLDAYDSYLNEEGVSGIPETTLETTEMTAPLLVDMNKDLIQEILQEIPENDISLYLDQDGYDDTEIMD